MIPSDWMDLPFGSLLLGSSLTLGAGWMLARFGPMATRQRAAELAVASTLAFAILAIVPLPRLSWSLPTSTIPSSRSTPTDATSTSTAIDRAGLDVSSTLERAPLTGTPIHAAIPDRPPAARPATRSPVESPAPVVAAPATATPDRGTVSPRDVAIKLWLVGAFLALIWLIVGVSRLIHIRVRSARAPSWVTDLVPGAADLDVRMLERGGRPFCFGLWRPVIVLPAALCVRDQADRTALVLRHELAHVHRRDAIGQAIFAVATPVLYFHPLFWLLVRRARFAAEVIADDAAARAASSTDYARCLLGLAEHRASRGATPFGAVAFLGSKPEFSRRIEMLLQARSPLPHRCTSRTRLTLAVASLAMVSLTAGSLGARPAADETAALRKQVEALQAENDVLRSKLDEVLDALRQREVAEAPPEQAADETADTREVTVRTGDTLTRIAARHLGAAGDWKTILRFNPNVDPSKLEVGQKLRLPAGPSPERVAAADLLVSERSALARDDVTTLGSAFELARELIEIRGDMEIADLHLSNLTELSRSGRVEVEKVGEMKIRRETLERKEQLIRRFLEGEVKRARLDLERSEEKLAWSMKLADQGYISETEVRADQAALEQARARFELLTDLL